MDIKEFGKVSNLNLSDIPGNINTKNKTISGDKFYVGEGILRCNNYFISLDSICMVEIGRRQESAVNYRLLILLGIAFCIISFLVFILDTDLGAGFFVMGIFLAILGFLGLRHNRNTNEKIPYTMSIRLSDNSTYAYHCLDKNFILSVMNVIEFCINNRKGGYYIMHNEEKIEKIDNSIHIGDNFSGNGDIIGGTGATKNAGNTNITNNNNNAITSDEWIKLEEYFKARQTELPIGERDYKICGHLASYSHLRDTGKIKGYLQRIGTEAIRMLFTTTTNAAMMETVKPIVNKILKG